MIFVIYKKIKVLVGLDTGKMFYHLLSKLLSLSGLFLTPKSGVLKSNYYQLIDNSHLDYNTEIIDREINQRFKEFSGYNVMPCSKITPMFTPKFKEDREIIIQLLNNYSFNNMVTLGNTIQGIGELFPTPKSDCSNGDNKCLLEKSVSHTHRQEPGKSYQARKSDSFIYISKAITEKYAVTVEFPGVRTNHYFDSNPKAGQDLGQSDTWSIKYGQQENYDNLVRPIDFQQSAYHKHPFPLDNVKAFLELVTSNKENNKYLIGITASLYISEIKGNKRRWKYGWCPIDELDKHLIELIAKILHGEVEFF